MDWDKVRTAAYGFGSQNINLTEAETKLLLSAVDAAAGGRWQWTASGQAVDDAVWDQVLAAVDRLRAKLLGEVFSDFTPDTLGNLVLWLDATVPSTLYADANKTVNAMADGDVLVWADRSPSGIDATQAATGKWPLRKVGVANGADAVRLDGVDDFLTLGDTLTYTDSFTVFVAGAVKNNNGRFISKRQNVRTYYDILLDSSNRLAAYDGATVHAESFSNPNDFHAYVIVIDGTASRFFVDGVALGSGPFPWTPSGASLATNTLIGAHSSGTAGIASADLVQMGMYARALGAAEVEELSTYLMAAVGI